MRYSPADNSTRASLLERLKNWEDQESWREFFGIYWRLIYSTAINAGLADAEAQDVVQETIITVAKKMPGFKYDRAIGSFKSWLLHTTRWKIADQFRKRGRENVPLDQVNAGVLQGDRPADQASLANDEDFESAWDKEWHETMLNAALERVRSDARRGLSNV